MIIHFCRGHSIGSKFISSIDGGPYSHVAISSQHFGDGTIIAHSTHSGLCLSGINKFKKKYDILRSYNINVNDDERSYLIDLLSKYIDVPYDWFGLIYLGLLKLGLMPKSKENMWQNRNYFICTEWGTKVILGKEDSLVGLVELEKLLKEKLIKELKHET